MRLQVRFSVVVIAAVLVESAPWALAQSATAVDGRTLAGESAATQGRFHAVWGESADTAWITEHNAELAHAAATSRPATGFTPTPATSVTATGPRPTAAATATAMPTITAIPTFTTTPGAGAPSRTATPTPEAGILTLVGGRGPPPEPRDETALPANGTAMLLDGEITSTPDGSIYVTGRLGASGPQFVQGDSILRIDPRGLVHTVLGPQAGRGDGGPAVDALLTPSGLALAPDGTLVIADRVGGVRSIDRGGTIRSLIRTSTSGQCEQRRTPTLCSASDVALADDGTLYVSDPIGKAVYRVRPSGQFEVVLGGVGATIPAPNRMALAPDGSLYIGVPNRVLRLTPDGTLLTVAGNGERPAINGDDAGDGGPALEARIGLIEGLAVASDGTVYVVDSSVRRLRAIATDGVIRAFAFQGETFVRTVTTGPDGMPYLVFADGIDKLAPDGNVVRVAMQDQVAPPSSRIYHSENEGVPVISTIAVASDGSIYAADSGRGRIQRVAPDGTSDHLAGASASLQPGAPAVNRRPQHVDHLLGAPDGRLYFRADQRTWQLSPDGVLSEALSARSYPLAIGSDGSVYYIADSEESGLRRRAVDGTIRQVPGFGTVWTPGAASVQLGAIGMLAVGDSGTIYAEDIVGNKVWRVQPGGAATVAYSGALAGSALDKQGRLYVSANGVGNSDWSRVDVVEPDGTVSRFSGTGVQGDAGDGGPARNALLARPAGLLAATDGSLLIVDRDNHGVRRVATDGTIGAFAGRDPAGPDGEPAQGAEFRMPLGIAVGPDGSVLVGDTGNYKIRRIDADGRVWTVAGTGSGLDSSPPPGPLAARNAQVRVGEVAVAPNGNLFAAGDQTVFREKNVLYHVLLMDLVREPAPIDPQAVAVAANGDVYITGGVLQDSFVERRSQDGAWVVIAGDGLAGYNGDDRPAVDAQVNRPLGLSIGQDGSVYVADTGNNRVRRITPDGRIHTVAGNGEPGFSGDGGPATQAALDAPTGIAVGADGTLFIADSHNRRIRHVAPGGVIETVAGTGFAGDGLNHALATQVDLNDPSGLALASDGSLFIADAGDGRIWRLWAAYRP